MLLYITQLMLKKIKEIVLVNTLKCIVKIISMFYVLYDDNAENSYY